MPRVVLAVCANGPWQQRRRSPIAVANCHDGRRPRAAPAPAAATPAAARAASSSAAAPLQAPSSASSAWPSMSGRISTRNSALRRSGPTSPRYARRAAATAAAEGALLLAPRPRHARSKSAAVAGRGAGAGPSHPGCSCSCCCCCCCVRGCTAPPVSARGSRLPAGSRRHAGSTGPAGDAEGSSALRNPARRRGRVPWSPQSWSPCLGALGACSGFRWAVRTCGRGWRAQRDRASVSRGVQTGARASRPHGSAPCS
jgi:hypothetical protein